MFNPETLPQNAEAAKSVTGVISSGGDCIMEMKFDGWRILAHVAADPKTGEPKTLLFSRTGKSQTGKLPEIEAELARNLPIGSWVDGEIVGIKMRADGSVEHNWSVAQKVMGAGVDKAAERSHLVTYMVFDVMALGGHDARSLPLLSRRKLLEQAFEQGDYERCVLTPQMEATQAGYEAILDLGFEGVIVKRLSLPYASGKRGAGWHKLKATHTEDVIITSLPHDGEGKYQGQVGAVVFSQIKDGKLVEMGRCSGMDDATRLDLSVNPENWIGRVIEVRHMGVMESGAWRHPVWMRVRDDKLAAQCVVA